MSEEHLQFVPTIRSGSFADIGPRKHMEDEHIRIDDLSAHLGSALTCPRPSAFYGVCKLILPNIYLPLQNYLFTLSLQMNMSSKNLRYMHNIYCALLLSF